MLHTQLSLLKCDENKNVPLFQYNITYKAAVKAATVVYEPWFFVFFSILLIRVYQPHTAECRFHCQKPLQQFCFGNRYRGERERKKNTPRHTSIFLSPICANLNVFRQRLQLPNCNTRHSGRGREIERERGDVRRA